MPTRSLLALSLAALADGQRQGANAIIDISTRVANWQGIPNLDNPWIGYPIVTAPAGWLGQGASQTFAAPGPCPTYPSCLQADGCTPGSIFNDPATPAVPGCAAGCVAWEATLQVTIPAGQGNCAIISGTAAADDNIAISVVNSRYPAGAYILGTATTGIGTWYTMSTISPVGQLDANGNGYFADGVNTLTMRIDGRLTCLMLAGSIDAYIDASNCAAVSPSPSPPPNGLPNPPPPPPSPSPRPPPVPVVAVFDPHFTFHHGGKADFKGTHNTWYNLLSAKEVSLNVFFTHADFNLVKPTKRVVHGSHMKEMVLTVLTDTGRRLTIEYNSTANNGKVRTAMIREATGSDLGSNLANLALKEIAHVASTTDPTPGNGLAQMEKFHSKTIDNVKCTMSRRRVAGMQSIALTVDTGKWEVTAWSVPFPNANAHPGKTLLNIKIAPSAGYDPEKDVVAPHGIIGQSYDGDGEGIDGAVDAYPATTDDFTTQAMAEGAIEGSAADYAMATKYETAFKYSRWGLAAAKPRDVSQLTGTRVGKERREKAAVGGGATADVMPTYDEVKAAEVEALTFARKA